VFAHGSRRTVPRSSKPLALVLASLERNHRIFAQTFAHFEIMVNP
jgi:hypothetical protein